MEKYNHKKNEVKWQKKWEKDGIYNAKDFVKKPKFYGLIEFPYPSGEGLHVGHIRSNTAMDIIARKRRMEGYNVLYPIGWDAFGLPTENYAIKKGVHPKVITKKNTDNFRRQLKSLGFSFDWTREINTTDPEYYKWTQWIFLRFFEHGLAYKKKMPINWCPSCKIGLANEEVVNGKCERCGTEAEKKEKEQWIIKITEYADKLLRDLKTVDYLEKIKIQQANWIGRSEGARVKFSINNGYLKTTNETWKFDPKLIPIVLSGEKHITYRTEKKNFKEGDICEFLNYKTKKIFALAKITKIENKKLKDIPHDLEGHEKFKNKKDFYNTYSKYYKIKANNETEIWLFYFELIKNEIEVFTTRPDTLFGATYLVLAPEHKIISSLKSQISNYNEIENYINQAKKKSDLQRIELTKEKTGVELKGIKALNPVNNEEIPIWISDYVLSGYGTGAIMAVPAHDERDFEFAKKFNLPIKMVICPNYPEPVCPILTEAYTGNGHLVGSEKFTGLESEKAKSEITAWLAKQDLAKKEINFKLRDWIFSRQHYWGEPIPLIFCENCKKQTENFPFFAKATKGKQNSKFNKGEILNPGWIAIPDNTLPVELPNVKKYQPTDTGESPLSSIKNWVNVRCPKCGNKAVRETDTMPNWAGSSWYFLRYTDPKNKKKFADFKKLKYFAPIDWYNGGMEHTTLHLLYSRFWNKFLYDIKLIPHSEPYKKRTSHGMVLGEGGEKMSKSRGNVINPDSLVKQFGADTVRLYEMFMGPFDQAIAWDNHGILGTNRFLGKVWSVGTEKKISEKLKNETLEKNLHKLIKKISEDIEKMDFNTAISSLMIFVNEMYSISEIPKNIWTNFLKLLSPFAPHITEELWQKQGNKKSIHISEWPKYDKKKIKEETFDLVIQINGKLRASFAAPINTSEEEAKKMVLENEKIKVYLNSALPKKIIFVPNKLINIVI